MKSKKLKETTRGKEEKKKRRGESRFGWLKATKIRKTYDIYIVLGNTHTPDFHKAL